MTTYRLSQRELLIAYLKIDPKQISESIEECSRTIDALRKEYEAIKAECDRRKAEIKPDKESAEKARDVAVNEARLRRITDLFYSNRDEYNRLIKPSREACRKFEALCDEYSQYDKRINDANEAVKQALGRKSRLENELAEWQRQSIEVAHHLPTVLEKVINYDGDPPNCDPQFGSDAELAGYIRGEIGECRDCKEGYLIVPISDDVYLILDDRIRHPTCEKRSNFNFDCFVGLIPPLHDLHRVHSLAPYARSPLSLQAQEAPLSKIPSRANGGFRGWLISGPAGSSKTTYVAAALFDMITFRATTSFRSLNCWRVKVPRWLRDMEAYETRDFGTTVKEPDITPDAIEHESKRSRLWPIVWLEELDKFNPTKNRLRNLLNLVDSIYEQGGLIISTVNETLPELRTLLGDSIYRRLTGENDDPEGYMVWDFWKLAKAKK